MTRRLLLIGLAGLTVAAFPVAAQNLITNGSFENPAYPEGFNYPVPVTGWTITPDPGFEVWHLAAQPGYAADGVQLVELEGSTCDTITQTVPVVQSMTYQLRFAYSARPGFGAQQMEVRWNGQVIATVSAAAIPAFQLPVWTYYTRTVLGAPGTNTVAFTALGPCDGAGSLLDNVSLFELQLVPALGGAGLALLAVALAVGAGMALRRL